MARRKQSMAEDIIEVTSKLPWWVGLLLAIISYFWLHSIAMKGLPQSSAGDIQGSIRGSFMYTVASLGQFFMPFLFGLGALGSIVGTLKRKRLYSEINAGLRETDDISWQEFELLIGEHFRRQGFSVKETSDGPDGGIDLILRKNLATYVVQCKHYKAYKVGVKPVRELLGVMASEGAAGGYVVTSGRFTADAMAFAKANNIALIDGDALQKILQATPKPSPPKSVSFKGSMQVEPTLHADQQLQVCPKCGSPLVERVARKGNWAGQKFWGCTKYPVCRFTLSID